MNLNDYPLTQEELVAVKALSDGWELEWSSYTPPRFKDSDCTISFDTFFSLSQKEYVKLVSNSLTRAITIQLTNAGKQLQV